jgi:hypothetical protein
MIKFFKNNWKSLICLIGLLTFSELCLSQKSDTVRYSNGEFALLVKSSKLTSENTFDLYQRRNTPTGKIIHHISGNLLLYDTIAFLEISSPHCPILFNELGFVEGANDSVILIFDTFETLDDTTKAGDLESLSLISHDGKTNYTANFNHLTEEKWDFKQGDSMISYSLKGISDTLKILIPTDFSFFQINHRNGSIWRCCIPLVEEKNIYHFDYQKFYRMFNLFQSFNNRIVLGSKQIIMTINGRKVQLMQN